jgi:hypothetical protein
LIGELNNERPQPLYGSLDRISKLVVDCVVNSLAHRPTHQLSNQPTHWFKVLLHHLLLPFALATADTGRAAPDTVREYRGVYETGFEVSWFRPCDAPAGDDNWWVTLTDDALRQRDSLARTLTGRPRAVFVRWRATLSPKMAMGAGHMGRGSRYMLVTEVLSIRPADEAGCTST